MASYRCAQCGEEFEMQPGSSLVAKAEAKLAFASVPEQDLVVVCGNCYQQRLPHATPETLKRKSWRRKHWWSKR